MDPSFLRGRTFRIIANIRWDDRCGNGYNTFSVTGDISVKHGKRWEEYSAGCIHDAIAWHFPELKPYIKWHLTSSEGPMYYVANTMYIVGKGKTRDLDIARSRAVWHDEELMSPDLKEKLLARLPKLLEDFRTAVESLGFTY